MLQTMLCANIMATHCSSFEECDCALRPLLASSLAPQPTCALAVSPGTMHFLAGWWFVVNFLSELNLNQHCCHMGPEDPSNRKKSKNPKNLKIPQNLKNQNDSENVNLEIGP